MRQLWAVRGVLLQATLSTIDIFIFSALVAIVISFVVGLWRLSPNKWLNWIPLVFGETFRGISLVVQLFWIFFVLPFFGITLSPIVAAVMALGLCFGAYGSEIVRAAMAAIPRGQREAALALGLSPPLTLMLVELPQAFAIMLPPFANLLVLLLKSTSVTALITVPELTFETSALSSNFGVNIYIFGYAMFAYYVLSRLIFWIAAILEHRMTVKTPKLAGELKLEPA